MAHYNQSNTRLPEAFKLIIPVLMLYLICKIKHVKYVLQLTYTEPMEKENTTYF